MRKFIFIGLLFLFACDNSKYKGFKSYNEFLHYKLNVVGESEEKLRDSCYLSIEYKYCTNLSCEDDIPLQTAYLNTHYYPDFWSNFRVGDQFVLLLDSNKNLFWQSLFDLHKKAITWPVIVHINLEASKYADLHYLGEKDEDFLTYCEETEITLMQQKYFRDKGKKFHPKNDCFIAIEEKGKGDTIKEESQVVLSYQAYFSNGLKFDDTDEWKDSLSFVFGQPLQIVKGLELGIVGLTEGTNAKIIIPSRLAFGEDGSSSGMVPPFEPILYDLKILSVIN